MGRTREALRYSNPGDRLDGVPLSAFDRISSLSGFQYYSSDFLTWEGPTADAAAPGTGGWIVTSVDGLADGLESVDVLDSQQFGILRIQSNDSDNDNTQLQMNGTSFRYVAGKRLWMEARIALQTANDGELGIGLIIEGDLDMVNTFPTDGIFFEKLETATDLDFHARKNGASTESTAVTGATLADATFFTIGFLVDAAGNVVPHYNGTLIPASAIASGNANIPDDEDLTFAIQIQTGSATTRYVDMDYLLVAQER